MLNIKIKRIIRKIFFIIIFTYNEKFILNASEFSIMENSHRTTYMAKNSYKLMAERFERQAEDCEKKAKLLSAQNRHGEAEEMIQKGKIAYWEELYLRTKYAKLLFDLATMEANIKEEANIKKYKECPKNDLAEYYKALAEYYKEGTKLFKNAVEEYYRAQMGFNDLANYYLKQSQLLQTQNRHEEAEKMLREAKKADQESKEIIKNQAYCNEQYAGLLCTLGNINEARDEYYTAAMQFDDLIEYYKKNARLLKKQNRDEEAEEMLKKAKIADQEATKAYDRGKYCAEQHEKLNSGEVKEHFIIAEYLP